MVNRAKIIIKRYFDEKGFKDAEVDIQQKEDATADNRVLVNIDIDKRSKVHVNRIYISGVTPKEASKLKRAMKKTHERTLLNFLKSKKFLPEKYGEDKDNVVKRLNAWGYRDAVLKSDSVAKVDDGHVDVYLDLSKGQKYYIRNISWVGNTVYSTDVLERILQRKAMSTTKLCSISASPRTKTLWAISTTTTATFSTTSTPLKSMWWATASTWKCVSKKAAKHASTA